MNLTHEKSSIKVKFYKDKLLTFYTTVYGNPDTAVETYVADAQFLSEHNWILKGDREELERKIRDALGNHYITGWIDFHVKANNAIYF